MNTILSSQDWDKLQAVFDSAADLDAEERRRYLDEACAADPRLRLRVESLLLSVQEEEEFAQAVGLGVAETLHTPMHTAGDRLGSYQIIGLIGHGGMGVVYRATRADDEYKKEVAIKVAASGFLTPEMRQRFLRERQILANLEHPNIARLLDGGTTAEGIPFVVMEYVEGKPLDAYCEQNRLEKRARIEAMIKVARAVDYAHRHLVVHRDLKPDNIHVTAEGEPKLLDFGIAKALNPDDGELNGALTMDATRLLTPDYASPEQVRGEPITTATDVYQLGILTYLLLTGRRPFQTRTANLGELQHAICEVPASRPNLEPDLDRILLHALEKEPSRRYRSAEDLASDLQRYLDGYPVQARTSSWVYSTRKFIGRHRLASALVVLFVVTLAGVAAAMTVLARRASQQAGIATQTTRFLLGIFEANDPDSGRGDKITARELLDKSAAQLDRTHDEDPVVQVQLLDSMGSIYNSLGASEKAREMLERSLNLRLQRLKGNDIEIADTLARMADVETDLSHYDAAIALNQRALATYRRRFGDNDERVAVRLARISSDYWEEDKLAQSEAYERDALKISSRLVSRADPRTLEMIGDLGTIVDLEGKPDEAEQAYDEFLKGEQALNPANLPNLGLAWNYKGWLHYRLGRFAEAEQEMRNALEMRIAAYGDSHPVTAGARTSLAYVLLCRQKAGEALVLAQRAKDDDEKTYGAVHRETSFAEDSLGLALLANGRATEARTQFQAALKARQTLLPPNHMQVAKTWMFLGQADYAAGNLTLAAEEARKAVALLEPVYGLHGHPQVAEFDALLLNVLAAEGNFKDAEEFGGQSIASFRKRLPSQNWRLAAIESALASSLLQDHQLERAEALLRESLAIDEKSYGPEAAQTAQAAIRLAECLAAEGKHAEEARLVHQYAPVLAASPDGTYKRERDWVRRKKARKRGSWEPLSPVRVDQFFSPSQLGHGLDFVESVRDAARHERASNHGSP